jgi:hypothetical protein
VTIQLSSHSFRGKTKFKARRKERTYFTFVRYLKFHYAKIPFSMRISEILTQECGKLSSYVLSIISIFRENTRKINKRM